MPKCDSECERIWREQEEVCVAVGFLVARSTKIEPWGCGRVLILLQEKHRELEARREREEREEKEREEALLRQTRPKRRRRRQRVEEEEEEEGFYQRHHRAIWAVGLVCAVVMAGSLGAYLVL